MDKYNKQNHKTFKLDSFRLAYEHQYQCKQTIRQEAHTMRSYNKTKSSKQESSGLCYKASRIRNVRKMDELCSAFVQASQTD